MALVPGGAPETQLPLRALPGGGTTPQVARPARETSLTAILHLLGSTAAALPEAMHRPEATGRPPGGRSFVEKVEALLGRTLPPRKPGPNPKAKPEAKPNCVWRPRNLARNLGPAAPPAEAEREAETERGMVAPRSSGTWACWETHHDAGNAPPVGSVRDRQCYSWGRVALHQP